MIYRIQRHIFKRLFRTFLMLVGLVLSLYMLLDFCTKAVDFADARAINYLFMIKFYGSEFAKKAHILVPICFSLTVALQLIHLSKTKEIVALLSAGMSYKKILKPFWFLAFLLSSFLFVNRHLIVPPTRTFLETYRNDHVRALKKTKNIDDQIFALVLKDDSKLIYNSFDPQKGRYFDLFWIISPQRVLRIKYLDQTDNGYTAHHIDELSRNHLGTLQKKHSFKELSLSKEWLKGAHFDKSLPIQTQGFDQMIKGLKNHDYIYSKDEIVTELLVMLIMSLSPFWIITMQAPFLSRYSRQIPVLFYIASQLLIFFCTSTLVEGLGIISQRSIASPLILLLTPFILGLYWLKRRYNKRIV